MIYLRPERNSCTYMGKEGKDLHNADRKACLSERWCMESSEEDNLNIIVSLRFVLLSSAVQGNYLIVIFPCKCYYLFTWMSIAMTH